MLGYFRDVEQPIRTWEQFDECAKLSQPDDLAQLDLADLRNCCDVSDNLESLLEAIGVT